MVNRSGYVRPVAVVTAESLADVVIYLLQSPFVLWVPDFNVSIGPSTCHHWLGCVGCKGQCIDGRRSVVHETAAVYFHGEVR